MNVVDRILVEWAYRCEKGYPDTSSIGDIKILGEIYGEYGINVGEDTGTTRATATQKDVLFLRKAFADIREDYAKYLKVFMLFDPNSLGTISEVLLTKLLLREGIETVHKGAGQGLTDLIVNGHRISLKTTSGTNKIGLGSEKGVNDGKAVELANHFKENSFLSEQIVKDLEASVFTSDIQLRLEAVAKKLSGDDNGEFFVWVEKQVNLQSGLLERITIHTHKFDYDEILETFNRGKVVPTTGKGSKSGWNLLDHNNKKLIEADIKSKYLNISPDFIRRVTKGTTVSVDFPILEQSKAELSDKVSKNMLESLDRIYREIIVV